MSFSWLHKLIRKKTRPIPFNKANKWRNRLSVGYAFIAWNMVGYMGKIAIFKCLKSRWVNCCIYISIRLLLSTVYLLYTGRLDKEYYGHKNDEIDLLSPAQRFALKSNIRNAKIINSTDFKLQDFNLDDYKHLQVDETKEKQKIDELDEDNVA